MIRLLLLLLVLLASGCATVVTTEPHLLKDVPDRNLFFVKKPPEFKKFREIYEKPYILFKYDCSNKCAEYVSWLKDKGIFSQLIVVDYDGPSVTKLIYVSDEVGYAIERHAIVRILYRGNFLYCDPTNFTWSSSIKDYAPAGFSGITNVVDYEDFAENERSYSF